MIFLCVKDGDTVIAHYKREHMAPGEMEHIKLPAAILKKVKKQVLEVAVVSAEGGVEK